MTRDQPVPQRFRAVIEEAVTLVREGGSGTPRPHDRVVFSAEDPLRWLREDGVDLVTLPDEAWASSSAGPVDGRPGTWWVAVDLWGPDGRTEHTLEGTVTEGDDGARLTVDDLRVL